MALTWLSHESAAWWRPRTWVDGRKIVGMAVNVRVADRDQGFLMPRGGADWLPEGHLAWFVLDVVAELDLSGFTGD